MKYRGLIIGLDLAGTAGIAEGCPGEVPSLTHVQLAKEHDDPLDTFARGLGLIAELVAKPRTIDGQLYGPGEAANQGLVRVAIEAPIMNPMIGNTNAQTQLLTKGLWATLGAFAVRRGCMVRSVTVGQCRKHFIGKGNERGDIGKRMARMMCEALGWKPSNLDAADAGAVWHWASWQWNPDLTPPTKPLWSRVAFEP